MDTLDTKIKSIVTVVTLISLSIQDSENPRPVWASASAPIELIINLIFKI